MDIDNAATFFVNSILMGMGFCTLAISIVFINNILAKYWKPVTIWIPGYLQNSPRFATDEELNKIPPSVNSETKQTR